MPSEPKAPTYDELLWPALVAMKSLEQFSFRCILQKATLREA
jgi:hypothetical protein